VGFCLERTSVSLSGRLVSKASFIRAEKRLSMWGLCEFPQEKGTPFSGMPGKRVF